MIHASSREEENVADLQTTQSSNHTILAWVAVLAASICIIFTDSFEEENSMTLQTF